MRVLGFDYGLKRIGVALANTDVHIANPLCTIQNTDKESRWKAITALVEEWRPDHFVVGLPLYLNGDDSEFSEHTKRFARQLEGRYNLSVDMVPEQLTSAEAEGLLKHARQSGKKNRTRKEEIDQLAASIILENWLEQHR